MRPRITFPAVFVAFATWTCLCVAGAQLLRADEALRWKFEVGEKLNYNMVQDMTMSVGEGQSIAKMHQETDMVWDVQGVDRASGEAVILQKFDRLKLKVVSPKGNIDYDSKDDRVYTGLDASIAPLYKAIAQNEFELIVTSRGEIKDAKIPSDVITALKNVPNASALGEFATEAGFKKMMSKSAFVLPENAPKKDEVSKTSVELSNKDGEKQFVETSYTYEGTKDLDGTTFAVFKPQLTMKYEGENRAGKPSIVQQTSDGEALFNVSKGRLKSMSLEQHVTLDPNSGSQPSQEQLDQKIDVVVFPRDDKTSATEPEQPGSSEAKSDK